MAKTRAVAAQRDIVQAFGNAGQRVLRRSEIGRILQRNRDAWRLPRSMTVNRFIEFLLARTELSRIVLDFPSRREVRYTWGDASAYEVALSVRPGSYLTHFTAVHLHGLTDQVPMTVYVNAEQAPKPAVSGELAQERIDWAFRKQPRVSSSIARIGEHRICLLHGMYTGALGVQEIEYAEGGLLRTAGIERTLIDIAVRPFYSGGVHEVLRAYQRAKGHFSVNRLAAMLRRLRYKYPYHQVIGFYLDTAGYKPSAVDLLRRFEIRYDFYLTYAMPETSYSSTWRLFVPKDMEPPG